MTAPTKPGTSRAACYLRVSTDRQTIENQRAEVEQLGRSRGYEIALYEETESAAKRRPVFDRMLADVRAGRIQAVVVWALDRFHRSMQGAINDVLELDRLGVRVLSVRESWLDTSGPVRSLLVAIFGWVAEQERSRLIERTKAGIERARRSGKRLGRPPCSPILLRAAAERVSNGESIRCAAALAQIPERSLRRFLAGAAKRPSPSTMDEAVVSRLYD